MRERIDISEVEAQTKIRAKYLRAIENEEWDLLPGPIYVKSFLRTYSDYLGLDTRMLIDEFKRRYEHPSENESRQMGRVASRDRNRSRERPPSRVRAPSWAPIGIAVVLIVVILYVVGLRSSGPSMTTTTQKRVVHHTPAATTTPKLPAAVPATRVRLHLVATNTVYVCLVNGQGTKLINEQTFRVGETIPSEIGRKLLLTLGNAGVQIKVNGRTVAVSPSPTAIRLLITPPNVVKPIPISQPPTCP